MPLFRSREVAVAVAGLSLAVALSAAATILGPPPADGLAAGSSLSKGPEGTAAAYLTLEALGYKVRRSFDPVSTLTIDPASTVVILSDPAAEASVADRRAIQRLVAAGATVIATGCVGGSFFSDQAPKEAVPGEPRWFPAKDSSPLTAGAPHVTMAVKCQHPDLAQRFSTIYGDAAATGVGAARIGRGLAMWWADNTPLTNRSVDADGHLELLLNAVGEPGRTVLWDEFYHGQRRSLYSYARQTPLPWLFAQAALVAVVAATMFVRRRAPVVAPQVTSRVSPLEFVDTMAGLYARANTAGDAVATARARLRRLLIEATGSPRAVDDARLAEAAAGRLRLAAGELSAALAAADAYVNTSRADDDEALRIVGRLQALSARFEHAGG